MKYLFLSIYVNCLGEDTKLLQEVIVVETIILTTKSPEKNRTFAKLFWKYLSGPLRHNIFNNICSLLFCYVFLLTFSLFITPSAHLTKYHGSQYFESKFIRKMKWCTKVSVKYRIWLRLHIKLFRVNVNCAIEK